MTYRQTLEYLYAQLPMFHRVGTAAYKKDLTNTLALCAGLGNPHQKFPAIHVAGTNGKGSVSYMLAAICQAAGLRTGLYISPHYKDFRERIRIDGQYISRRKVVDFVIRHRSMIESIEPSFFEMCVAMAFDHFAAEKVDIAIIEVGLGGRLDSTNVISPLIGVITNISYDHMNLLGDTLPLIAGEKAGIIKPGIPAVIGETHPESAPVFLEKARSTGSPIFFADQILAVAETGESNFRNSQFQVTYPDGRAMDIQLDAAGPFQVKNIATALQTIEVLNHSRQENGQDFLFTETAIQTGLAQLRTLTGFIGRWQIIGERPTILCDSAHNEAGLKAVLGEITQNSKLKTQNHGVTRSIGVSRSAANSKLKTTELHGVSEFHGAQLKTQNPKLKTHFVVGFVNDKDLDKVLCLFPADARYYFAKANIPRGLPADALRRQAAAYGLKGRAYSSVKNALKAAKRAASPDDLIAVIGSIFVVGEVI